jgi:hypothetical protein
MGSSNEYVFQSRWRVESTREEVFALIDDLPSFARWWPSVWLKVETLATADANGVGATYRLTSKGWLPYLLHWTSRTIEKKYPERIAVEATGDFQGGGVWTFAADGPMVDMVYDWRIRADKPLLRRLSFLLKPLFAFNHNWAMKKGLVSIKLELARIHAKSDDDRSRIPPAPPAVFWFGKPREL